MTKFYSVVSEDQVILGSAETGVLTIPAGVFNFDKIYQLAADYIDNYTLEVFYRIKQLSDVRGYLTTWSAGAITTDEENNLYFKDLRIPSSLSSKLLQAAEDEDLGLSAWYNFLQKLSDSSHEDTYSRLHEFLKHNNITINAEGNILAWKVVTSDFKDCYTSTFDNSVGQVVSMPRQSVEHNVDRTCSRGLHACAFSYVQHFGGNDSNLILVEIDVRNIVSVPTDYNGAKVRCCEYKVLHSFGNKGQVGDKTPFELLAEYEKVAERDWVLEETQ